MHVLTTQKPSASVRSRRLHVLHEPVQRRGEPLTKKSRNSVPQEQVASMLGISLRALKYRIIDGMFTWTLIEGEAYQLATTKIRDGASVHVLFEKSAVENLQKAIAKEQEKIVTLTQLAAGLNAEGVKIAKNSIYNLLTHSPRDKNGATIVQASRKRYNVRMKTARASVNFPGFEKYVYRDEAAALVAWAKTTYTKSKNASEGYVWLADAERKLGLKASTLKKRLYAGSLKGVKKVQGRHAISNAQFKRLQEEFAEKKPEEGSMRLREALQSVGLQRTNLVDTIRREGNSHYFTFKDAEGKEREIPFMRGIDKAYWVKPADLETLRIQSGIYAGSTVFCNLHLVSRAVGKTIIALQCRIDDDTLYLPVPDQDDYHMDAIKRGRLRLVPAGALLCYLERTDPRIRELLKSNLKNSKLRLSKTVELTVSSKREINAKDFETLLTYRDRLPPTLPNPLDLVLTDQIMLCKDYGIGVKLNDKGEAHEEDIEVLRFYRKLFFAKSEAEAMKLAREILDNPSESRDDVSLAKLWLVRYFYVTKTLDVASEEYCKKKLDLDAIKTSFRIEPSKGSRIFLNGIPKATPREVAELAEVVNSDPDSERAFVYPA